MLLIGNISVFCFSYIKAHAWKVSIIYYKIQHQNCRNQKWSSGPDLCISTHFYDSFGCRFQHPGDPSECSIGLLVHVPVALNHKQQTYHIFSCKNGAKYYQMGVLHHCRIFLLPMGCLRWKQEKSRTIDILPLCNCAGILSTMDSVVFRMFISYF